MQAKELVWQGSRRIHKRPVFLARGRADIAGRPYDEEEFVVLDSRSMRGFPCICENWLALVDLAGDEAGIAELALWASRLILVDTSLTPKPALCTGAISLSTVCIP